MKLIVNADDFGRSHEINRAVLRAYRLGALNSASLMVAGEAVSEAIEIARDNPGLAVGLHLVVVDGPAVLLPEHIPNLINAEGRFPNRPAWLGLRYALRPSVRSQLGAEIAAQFSRFHDTGIALSHVDGHQHMHMHPVVLNLLLPLARQFGARRIRVVRDDLALALRYNHRQGIPKSILAAVFALLASYGRRRCRDAGIDFPTRTYGFFQSGGMDEAYVTAVLDRCPDNAEIYFHPIEGPRLDILGPNPQDLATLLSPVLRRAIKGTAVAGRQREPIDAC